MYQPIDSATRIGRVSLTVRNLDESLAFYQQRLGFTLHRRDAASAVLGAGGPDLLELVENRAARQVRNTTGLYHFAVLLPSRLELAQALRLIALTQTPLGGASDHLVSEALYLDDPDGNGIEIYRDRPRAEWPRAGNEVQMATDPLDLDGILAELSDDQPWPGLPGATTIGHIHLHVAQIAAAKHFYCDLLGFDQMQLFGGSALFVSAGGYHHHIGLNTWAGVGAPPPPADAVGLRHFEVVLPSEAARDAVVARLEAAQITTQREAGAVVVRDPSQNTIHLVCEA